MIGGEIAIRAKLCIFNKLLQIFEKFKTIFSNSYFQKNTKVGY